MNLPNKLSFLRVLLIPVFLLFVYLAFPGHMYAALAVFVLASLTDLADGIIARKHHLVTDFGKFLDPLADKVLVMAAMLWFVEAGRMPAWCMLLVVAREFAVTALRLVAVGKGRVIAAAWSGKIKTASTMIGICLMLAATELPFLASETVHILDIICVAVIVVTTVYSGVEYFVRNRDAFSGAM